MSAPARLDVFAPITKRERDPKTGHLYVYGKITGPDLDRDQQRMDAEWLKAAVPEWFTRGNIREGHDHRRAVGKAVDLEEKDDGWYIGAKIVDRDAIEKVEEEVLTGFSIGIKGPRLDHTKADAPNGTIVSGRICETSLVDVPCLGSATITDHWEIPLAKSDAAGDLQPVEQPELIRVEGDASKSDAEAFGLPQELYDRLAAPVKTALATLAAGGATVAAQADKTDTAGDPPPLVVNVTVQGAVMSQAELAAAVGKADLSAAGRKKAASSGAAMPDGTYPITTKADLRKAVKAVGRGGTDHDKIRKHIITRAKALGLEDLVPDNWNSDGSVKPATKADDTAGAANAETVAKAEQILRDVRVLAPSLVKADGEEAPADGEDESGDIAGAEQAIAVIAKLIIAEAESLAQGNLNEACDIDLLLSAVRSLAWFKQREENEESGDTGADMGLADQPDITKTDAPAATPAVEPATQTPDATTAPDTVTKADVAELVKAAVAEATVAAKERETALANDLVKAQQAIEEFRALPVPGGPALTRTADQQHQARTTDADRMRAEAKGLMAKADAAVDPVLRKGYSDRATELLEKADA